MVGPTAAPTAEPAVPEPTTPYDHEVPGQQPGHSVLSRLISVTPSTFAGDYWGRQALLSKAIDLPHPFTDLLDAGAVDELVSERGLRTPFLRVAKAGSTLGERAFTAGGGVGASVTDQVSDDKLVRLFADGSTLVLQALHRVWPPVLRLCQQLAAELGHPVQANAYVTPPQNQGFGNHYDVHDVFVLQIEGEKKWILHAPVLESPLRDQPWTDRRTAVEQRAAEPPLLETVLQPGDCLYLPRGFLHAAQALGGVSTHLTIGVHVWTGYGIAEQLLSQALQTVAGDPEVRRSLPVGTSFDDASGLRSELDAVRAALVRAVEQVDEERLMQILQQQSRSASRAAPVGPLRQLHDASALGPDTTVVLRAHLQATLSTPSGTRTVIQSRAGDFGLTEDEVTSAKLLLLGEPVPAG
ncbi:MAG TPA: cupin domain-containing protein, partial [Propionibacteriaceae bacterium]